MMKKLNNKGSTIITGIIIVMILLIITGTTLGIAYNYQKRAINEHARKQAYLNGISVVDAIALQVTENDSIIPTTINDSVEITDVTLPTVGDVQYGGEFSDVKIVCVADNTISIQLKSTYYNQTEEVKLTMQKYNNQWYKKAYSNIGDKINEEIQ